MEGRGLRTQGERREAHRAQRIRLSQNYQALINETSWPLAADTEENIYCATTRNTYDLDRPAYGL